MGEVICKIVVEPEVLDHTASTDRRVSGDHGIVHEKLDPLD
jgi:hypothetical protein